jgi:hypothetical protein
MENDENKTDATMVLTAYFTEKWRQIWFEFMTNPDGLLKNISETSHEYSPSTDYSYVIYPRDMYWEYLSSNANTTMELVENNLDKPWSFYAMSSNPNLTMKFVSKHMNKCWNWKELGKHEFAIDKKQYVEMQIQKVLLASIYNYNKNNPCKTTNILERILFDEYIMSKIIAY